ncbi:PQQ-dependent dehydrogenase, methanol/ethanol family [Kineobactrum sediminis]|uniref:PQQ-dependent dehydrogenase, methanol/ethanol family n=1 Tax=Kineobactrum sediminis TaxID=1905677 RepID=A0A2N5Y0F1_9GAMM|nr:PQQ-dependent dehydrogenase, methanol/ethanol family [Kineobactrum sediminis]PLW81866.1 PQQ-dependent dehydrogenase, methanol/ethanol family [Kineobactrum sediminis]
MPRSGLTAALLVPFLIGSILLTGCDRDVDGQVSTADTDATTVDMGWATHGLDDAETRFSPLQDINARNVTQLGLDWYFDYPTARGKEATPLVIDRTIYTTGSWSMVFAHDAITGELLWFHDPKVPREWAVHLCCDVVNRGVAHDDGRLFFGTLDGRLVALDASSGERLWEAQTTDRSRPYSITGAPRIIKGRAIIGNGGSELGVRGYVSAYDLDTGSMAWRFYTVPGNPEQGFENEAMKTAAATWGGGAWWEIGGGGTVWDSMAYDPELDLLYIGVGNGAPWNRQIRSPDGGDNLYLSSVVALNPNDGSYVWHYQTSPGETWDYTATQHMILADLELDGRQRKVLMQAPKNGFFYVLDRATGELLSAEPYAGVTWASHVDMETGRPVENPASRYEGSDSGLQLPGPIGGHNWHPMSYSPDTGLVYIPKQDVPWVYAADEQFEYKPGYWNTGTDSIPASLPDDPEIKQTVLDTVKGAIVAWDPVAAEPRWEVTHAGPWNGGMLSTAGNLLFQGNAEGRIVAYTADTGEDLWSFDAQTGIVAPPVTYRIDGVQYVAVVAGWGGALALVGGEALTAGPIPNRSRLLVFRLGADDTLPDAATPALVIAPPELEATPEQILDGKVQYLAYCVFCHGDGAVSGGATPDLRAMSAETHAQWDAIVRGGQHWQGGMVGFAGVLGAQGSENIRQYLIERAHQALLSPPETAAAP